MSIGDFPESLSQRISVLSRDNLSSSGELGRAAYSRSVRDVRRAGRRMGSLGAARLDALCSVV